jgi:hypothetical protein
LIRNSPSAEPSCPAAPLTLKEYVNKIVARSHRLSQVYPSVVFNGSRPPLDFGISSPQPSWIEPLISLLLISPEVKRRITALSFGSNPILTGKAECLCYVLGHVDVVRRYETIRVKEIFESLIGASKAGTNTRMEIFVNQVLYGINANKESVSFSFDEDSNELTFLNLRNNTLSLVPENLWILGVLCRSKASDEYVAVSRCSGFWLSTEKGNWNKELDGFWIQKNDDLEVVCSIWTSLDFSA